MKYLKINGKSVEIPTEWDEMTFRQYLEYQKIEKPDVYSLVSLFTGIPREDWEKSKEVKNFYLILECLEFVTKEPKKKVECPEFVEIGDVAMIEVPKNIEKHTVKQYEDMRIIIQNELKEEGKITYEIYPRVIAVYLAEPVFGEYSIKNWKKAQEIIKNLSFYQVIGMGNFFLTNLSVLRNGTSPGVPIFTMMKRKLGRALRIFRRGVS